MKNPNSFLNPSNRNVSSGMVMRGDTPTGGGGTVVGSGGGGGGEYSGPSYTYDDYLEVDRHLYVHFGTHAKYIKDVGTKGTKRIFTCNAGWESNGQYECPFV